VITRTAIFEGRIKAGCEARFMREFRERLVPLWQQFPHARNIRLLPVVGSDEDARPIALIQQINYPSRAALEEAIASPARAQARTITLELMQMFEARLYHVVSQSLLPETSV
jgi:hypothetical protein